MYTRYTRPNTFSICHCNVHPVQTAAHSDSIRAQSADSPPPLVFPLSHGSPIIYLR